MRFSAVLVLASAALAQTIHTVVVGNNNELAFSPPSIDHAQSGDTLHFIFAAMNHTATQSSFADPCTALGPSAVDTGFQPVSPGSATTTLPGNASALPAVSFALTNLTGPLWFYCQQTSPVDHCRMGMVFAVNPTANQTLDAFRQAALASANSTTSAAPTSTASTASAGPSSAASGSASKVSGNASATNTGSDSLAPSASAGGPWSAANGTSPAPQNSTAGARRVGAAAGALLGGVGVLVFGL